MNHRTRISWILTTLVGICIALNAGLAVERPNVVILYGDDVGYGDVGIYGSRKIPTPNLDRFAAQGLRFTDGHCSASTCTPSRYSLLTGELPFRKQGTGIARGDANMIISPNQFTLADVFQQAGYKTAVIGKWHLGLGEGTIQWNGDIEPGPEALGFEHTFIFPATNDRTPCVYIENGQVDLLASFAALLGVTIPQGHARDSRNYLAALVGDEPHGAEIIMETSLGRLAIRRNHWKYIATRLSCMTYPKTPVKQTTC